MKDVNKALVRSSNCKRSRIEYTKEEYAVESKFTTLLFRIIIQSMEGEPGLEFICNSVYLLKIASLDKVSNNTRIYAVLYFNRF